MESNVHTLAEPIVRRLARLAQAGGLLNPPPDALAALIPTRTIISLLRRALMPVGRGSQVADAPQSHGVESVERATAPFSGEMERRVGGDRDIRDRGPKSAPGADIRVAHLGISPETSGPTAARFLAGAPWKGRWRGAVPLDRRVRRILIGDAVDEALESARLRRRTPTGTLDGMRDRETWATAITIAPSPSRRLPTPVAAANSQRIPPQNGGGERIATVQPTLASDESQSTPATATISAGSVATKQAEAVAIVSRIARKDVRSFFQEAGWEARKIEHPAQGGEARPGQIAPPDPPAPLVTTGQD